MMFNSSTTGRAARSLAEAFGPYETGPVHPMQETYRRAHWAMYIVTVIGVCVIFYFK